MGEGRGTEEDRGSQSRKGDGCQGGGVSWEKCQRGISSRLPETGVCVGGRGGGVTGHTTQACSKNRYEDSHQIPTCIHTV